jgi:hypothetical protein
MALLQRVDGVVLQAQRRVRDAQVLQRVGVVGAQL